MWLLKKFVRFHFDSFKADFESAEFDPFGINSMFGSTFGFMVGFTVWVFFGHETLPSIIACLYFGFLGTWSFVNFFRFLRKWAYSPDPAKRKSKLEEYIEDNQPADYGYYLEDEEEGSSLS